MPDYQRLARELRAKANYVPPPGSGLAAVGAEEKAALLAKADELERNHPPPPPPPPGPPHVFIYRNSTYGRTDDTTVTNRSGQRYTTHEWPTTGRAPYIDPQMATYWYDILNDLLIRQPGWNKPPDEEDIISEEYRTNDFDYEYEEDYDNE